MDRLFDRLQGKAGWALLGLVALLFPLFAQNNYLISVATQAFIMALAAL
ncbi:MAG: branched-chain amino acid ABC transporter permease, partial [Comamonadaceae bacterium]